MIGVYHRWASCPLGMVHQALAQLLALPEGECSLSSIHERSIGLLASLQRFRHQLQIEAEAGTVR